MLPPQPMAPMAPQLPPQDSGMTPATPPEPPEKISLTPEKAVELARKWLAEVATSEKNDDKFRKAGEKITKRYREETDEGEPVRQGSKFNIFWANVQTLAPATYSRRPKVEVTRRFRDQDPVARMAATILERSLQYEIDHKDDFHQTMKAVVLDRLLPGRGVAWVRYEPAFKKVPTLLPTEDGMGTETKEVEELADEHTPVDYVYWKDYLVSVCRTWGDRRWVGRKVMFSKSALKARFEQSCASFGGKIEEVPCDYDPSASDKTDPSNKVLDAELADLKRAVVYELWDKETKQLIWVVKGYQYPLDVQEDELEIPDCTPTPLPLLATMTNDKFVPVADFRIYQEQIRELDNLTTRISILTKALRVIGLYDASQAALSTMLQSGVDNRMIPVNAWAAFAEKGGLKGSVDFVPLEQVIKVLTGLYDARDRTKQLVYELTGMADIIRGASVASETLGAQEIKAKFANLRLSSRQQQVAEFVTGVLQLKAHIMCRQYSPETLKRISCVDQVLEAQEHPERVEAAIALLKNEGIRNYRLEVQSSSLVELDKVEEQKTATDFMSMMANFMLGAKNIAEGTPEMMPVVMEMLKFVIRRFSVGRGLEAEIEDASEAIKKRLTQPQQPPQPSPDVLIKKAIEEAKIASNERIEALKADTTKDVAELKASLDMTIAGLTQNFEAMMAVFTAMDAQMDAEDGRAHEAGMAQQDQAAQAQAAEQEAQRKAQEQAQAEQEGASKKAQDEEAAMAQKQQQEQFQQTLMSLLEKLSAPRKRVPQYDAKGNITHVIETTGDQ